MAGRILQFIFWLLSGLFLLSSTAAYSENRMNLGFSCTGVTSCDNNAEALPPTKPGKKKKFTVEIKKSTGSDDYSNGLSELLPSGIMRFSVSPESATGRLTSAATYNRNNREGLSLDSFLIFRSFFSDSYFNVLSSSSSCKDTPASPQNYNWVIFRGRSPQSISNKIYANDTSYKFAGVVNVSSDTSSILDGTGAIDLNTLSLDSSSYNYSPVLDTSCSVNTQKIAADSSYQPLGVGASLYWGDNSFVAISRGANPNVALGIPQTNLTSQYLAELAGNSFSGMMYYQSAVNSATFKTLLISPNNTGTQFNIQELSDISNPNSATSWGSLTCSDLNSPAQGFCKGTLTKSGQTGNALCAFGTMSSQGVMACTAQLPSNKAMPIYFFGTYPARAALAVAAPTIQGLSNTQACSNVTITNGSGKVATNFSLGTLPSGVSLGPNAYDGQNGRCGTKVEAFQSCTVPVCVTMADTDTREIATVYHENDQATSTVETTLAFNKAPVPVINVNINTASGVSPLNVTFSASATVGNIETWVYDFGDASGDSTSLPEVTHTFQTGTYSASVYGIDSFGQQSNTVSFTVTSFIDSDLDGIPLNDDCSDHYYDPTNSCSGNVKNGDQYVWYGGSYYAYFGTSLSWAQAKQACVDGGGHLATVSSEAEDNVLWNLTNNYSWLGFTDRNSEGSWRWITGESFSYTNWHSTQPDNASNLEHYGHNGLGIYFGWGDAKSWNDCPMNCSIVQGYTCEYFDGQTDVEPAILEPSVTSLSYNDSTNQLTINGVNLTDMGFYYVLERNWWNFGFYEWDCSKGATQFVCNLYLPNGSWDLYFWDSSWNDRGYIGTVTSNRPAPTISSTSYDTNTGTVTMNGTALDQFMYLSVLNSNWNGVGSWYSWDCGASISSNQVTCTIGLTTPGHYYAYFYDNWWMSYFFEFDIVENITGNVLLLHMDGTDNSTTFTDSSPRNYTIAPEGNPIISTSQYRMGSASGYFDGNGDYLNVVGSNQFNFGTQDFTVEMWVYPLSYGGSVAGAQLFGTTNGSTSGWSLNLGESGDRLRLISNMTGVWQDDLVVSPGGGPALNQWSHIALTRSGDTVRIFKNGNIVAQGSGYSALNFAGGDALIGRFNDGTWIRDFEGFIDEVNVMRGTALYTANFTPPQLPINSNTVLLMHMDGANNSTTFTDDSDYKFTANPINNTIISTTKSKIGGASARFDGSSELKINFDPAFNFGTGDFTIEGWINPSSIADHTFLVSGGQTGALCVAFHNSGTILGIAQKGVGWALEAPVSIKANTWYHVAVSRSSGTVRVFLDGLLVGSQTGNFTSYDLGSGGTYIGSHGGSWGLNGYIDEVRVTRGKALYTASFAPPITEFISQDTFTGDGVYDEFCYDNFVSIGAVGGGTGYCAGDNTFYIGGVPYPGLDSTGTGASGTQYFVNGLPYSGYLNNICYDNSFNTLGVVAGSGWCSGNDTYYIGGIATNLDSSGNGTYQGKYYIGGVVANGVVRDKTALLLHMDGANNSTTFVDSSSYAVSVNRSGSAVISTSLSKFGGASGYIPTYNSYSSTNRNTITTGSISISAGEDFTIEAWYYQTNSSYSSNQPRFLEVSDGFGIYLWDNVRRVFTHDGTWYGYVTPGYYSSVLPALNTWHHIAVTRKNGTLRTFLDGQFLESGSFTKAISGSFILGAYDFAGYIDEFRVLKGEAAYIASFTPQTSPFEAAAGCYNNGYITNDLNANLTGTCSGDGRYYVRGVPHYTLNGTYYIGSTPTTLDSNGNGVWGFKTDATPTVASQGVPGFIDSAVADSTVAAGNFVWIATRWGSAQKLNILTGAVVSNLSIPNGVELVKSGDYIWALRLGSSGAYRVHRQTDVVTTFSDSHFSMHYGAWASDGYLWLSHSSSPILRKVDGNTGALITSIDLSSALTGPIRSIRGDSERLALIAGSTMVFVDKATLSILHSVALPSSGSFNPGESWIMAEGGGAWFLSGGGGNKTIYRYDYQKDSGSYVNVTIASIEGCAINSNGFWVPSTWGSTIYHINFDGTVDRTLSLSPWGATSYPKTRIAVGEKVWLSTYNSALHIIDFPAQSYVAGEPVP